MALEAAVDSREDLHAGIKIPEYGKTMVEASVCEQLEPQEKLLSSSREVVELKPCIIGKEDNKYVCETHGKKFTSRQYMNVHLTNSGMEPLPKLKRGRKSVADANSSLQDGENSSMKDHLLENKADLSQKKQSHLSTSESGMAIISASKRGRKPYSTASLSSEALRQDCVVEQYDDGYVCETHGLKYGSRHTINVHLMHCGMEPLPKLKRGRKSATTPSEGTRRRYEPSRIHEIAVAMGMNMNEKSSDKCPIALGDCVSLPERLDTGLNSAPRSDLCIQKKDDLKRSKDCDSSSSFYRLLTPKLEERESVKGIEGVSGHLKLQVV